MLCLLQVSTELAIRTKAELMKREAGFGSGEDEEVKARLVGAAPVRLQFDLSEVVPDSLWIFRRVSKSAACW